MLSLVQKAFRKSQTGATQVWSDLVKRHTAGKSIDLDQLRAAGLELGIPVPRLAHEFDVDVQGFQKHQSALREEQEIAKALPAVAKAAETARARIPALQEELARLVDDASSAMPMAGELASRKRLRESLEAAHPRLFGGVQELVTPEPEPEVDPDEAVFLT